MCVLGLIRLEGVDSRVQGQTPWVCSMRPSEHVRGISEEGGVPVGVGCPAHASPPASLATAPGFGQHLARVCGTKLKTAALSKFYF